MDAKDAYIEKLENTIRGLQQQVNNLTEMVLLLRKEKFDSSREKTPGSPSLLYTMQKINKYSTKNN